MEGGRDERIDNRNSKETENEERCCWLAMVGLHTEAIELYRHDVQVALAVFRLRSINNTKI